MKVQIIELLETTIARYKKTLDFINSKRPAFEQLEVQGIVPSLQGYGIDFDNLKREQVLLVIKVLAVGKWEKSPNYSGTTLDYSNVQDGFNIRIWGAEPPASCQLIEEEYEEPAQPAKISKRFRLVCSGDNE